MRHTWILPVAALGAFLAFSQQPPAHPAPPAPPTPPTPKVWSKQTLSADEEVKLAALDGLMRNDPKRAIPILEKMLQAPGSTGLRLRALSSLRHTDSPEAIEALTRIARNHSNPELQLVAIKLLGTNPENVKLLSEIYGSSSDAAVKKQVLRAWMTAAARDELLKAAKQESSAELRKEAIHLLGATGGAAAGSELASLYGSTQDREVRKAVLRALMISGNSKALIDIARKETDPELKKTAVRHMAHMRDSDVTAFLMEVIEK